MVTFSERLKTRIPNWGRFVERARADRRAMVYDLLPLLSLGQRDGLSRTMAAFRPKTPDFKPSQAARTLYRGLMDHGITDMQGPLQDAVLRDLLDHFKTTQCHDPFRPHLGRFDWDKPPSDEVNIGYFSAEEVITAPHMLDLVNHPDILATAELFFGCKPVIDNIGASWSYPGRETAKGAQRFHRDFDCARSFKAFFYLTDVDMDCGPHVYVRGSNRQPILESGRAQTDDTIVATFGADAIQPVLAPAGSWFLEDVYGFHKGIVPKTKPRLLVAIEYNLYPSPFSPKDPILPRDDRYDAYINRLFLKP